MYDPNDPFGYNKNLPSVDSAIYESVNADTDNSPKFGKKSMFTAVGLLMMSLSIVSGGYFISQRTSYESDASTMGVTTSYNEPTYYVDCQSGNDTNDGITASTAWKTVVKLKSKALNPGEVVGFKTDCSYDTGATSWGGKENAGWVIASSGTAEMPIVVTSYGGGAKPVFFNSTDTMIYVRGIDLRGSYLVLDGLAVRDVFEHGVIVSDGARKNVIANMEISNVGYGVNILGSDNVVRDSYIHDLKMIQNTNNGGDDDYGASAFVILGSGNEIVGNRVENAIATSYDYGVDGGAVEFFGYDQFTGANNNLIHHNTFSNSDGIVEFGSTNNATFSNNVFAFNLMVNNGRLITAHNSSETWGVNLNGNEFFNNTIYENSSEWNFSGNRRAHNMFNFANNPSPSSLNFYNNIVSTRGVAKISSHDGFTHTNNLYDVGSATLGIALQSSEISGSAGFVDPLVKNLHLLGTSLAINFGKTQTQFATDFDGQVVGQGGGYEMGVYEYVSGATPSPTPLPTATPTPLPTPTPTPVVNQIPVIKTNKLATPAFGKAYSANIVGEDKDVGDVITMTASGLPTGLSFGSCQSYINSTNAKEISCSISGTATVKGSYSTKVTLTDSKGASVSKTYGLRVR